VDDARAGRGVAGGGDPRGQEQAPIGSGEGEEPTELADIVADLGDERADTADPQRRPGRALAPRLLGRYGRGGG
jgi:hypothetical protein